MEGVYTIPIQIKERKPNILVSVQGLAERLGQLSVHTQISFVCGPAAVSSRSQRLGGGQMGRSDINRAFCIALTSPTSGLEPL